MINRNETADLAFIYTMFSFSEKCGRDCDFKMVHKCMVADRDFHNIIDTQSFQLTFIR